MIEFIGGLAVLGVMAAMVSIGFKYPWITMGVVFGLIILGALL